MRMGYVRLLPDAPFLGAVGMKVISQDQYKHAQDQKNYKYTSPHSCLLEIGRFKKVDEIVETSIIGSMDKVEIKENDILMLRSTKAAKDAYPNNVEFFSKILKANQKASIC